MSHQIRAMSFAELLDTAFRLVRDHFTVLVGLAATIHVPLAIVSAQVQPEPGQVSWGSGALALVLSLVGTPIVTAALTHAIGEIYLGRPASIGRSLRVAFGIVVPLTGTMVLLYLGVLVGLVLLVIPGIYLMLVWALAWEVIVLEGRMGTAALARSRELMRGNILRAVGIFLVSGIIVGLLGSVLNLVFGLIPVLGPIGQGLAQALGGAYGATVAVLLYFDIRCRKEAFDLEHLARIVEGPGPVGSPAPA